MCVNCNNNACGGCQPVIPQGLPGVNGKNAYTFTTTSFTMPAVSSNVTITVQSTGQFSNQWAIPGQIVYIDGAGYFTVVSKTGNNQITVTNLGYSGNATPGVTITSNVGVSPAGLQGATGASGSAGSNGIANLYSNSVVTTSAITGAWTTLATYTVPSNTLVTSSASLADALQITVGVAHNTNTSNLIPPSQDRVRLNFFGYTIERFLIPVGDAQITSRLTKASASTLNSNFSISGVSNFVSINQQTALGAPFVMNNVYSGINFATSNTISVDIYQQAAGRISLEGFYIDKIVA